MFSGTGAPTGLVSVLSGSTTLCTFTLSASENGAGGCTESSATVLPASGSPYPVTAVYAGDTNFTTSTSPSQNLMVNQATSSSALTLSASALTYGQGSGIGFSVTVSPQFTGAPTGLVSVMTGATTLCTFTLSAAENGVGGCTESSTTALDASSSPYPVTAVYAGDSNFTTSTSSPQNLTVNQATSSTALTLSESSVAFGGETAVQFNVTVSPQFSGAPTGLVSLTTGSTTLCTVTLVAANGGHGSCNPTSDTILDASATPYPIIATYAGDANFAGSASSSQNLTILSASSTTALSLSSSSVAYGNETTEGFSVTVTSSQPGSPTGLVTVKTGSTTLCSFTLTNADDGAGSCKPTSGTILATSSTPYPVTATYAGDTDVAGSTSSPAQNLTVNKATSSSALTLSASALTYGQGSGIGFSVTVSPQFTGAPTGLVSVMSGSTTLCTFTLSAAENGVGGCTESSATVLPASGSPYPVTAVYAGDTNFTTSTSPSQNLMVNQATSSSALTLSASALTYGQGSGIGFSVTVSPQFTGAPTGLVSVMTGATTLCTFTLSAAENGVGGCTESSTTALDASSSPYPVTAVYAGDSNFTTSTSSPQNLTVNQATSSTALTLSESSVAFGGETAVQFNVTVSPQFSGAPTGLVSLTTGSTTLCTVTLVAANGGHGSCNPTSDTILDASATPYPIIATYAGDANFAGSAPSPSKELTVTSGGLPTTTTVSPSISSVTYGNESLVEFTVMVTSSHPGIPNGIVTVATGGTTICSFTLTTADDGTGQCGSTSPTVLDASSTPYAVTATYDGNSTFSPSTSDPTDLTVNQDTSHILLSISPIVVTYGGEQNVTFTGSPTPPFPSPPTGSVTVAAGSTTLCVITLPATGCHIGATMLDAGGYTVTATYGGDTNFQSSSDSAGLTVSQATPSLPSITNLPSGAAEEGSFVASVATNGDGTTSVVSQTTATCTVGGDGLTVSFLEAGACTLTPQLSNGTNYTGASGSPQTFTIGLGPRGYWLVGSDGGIFSFGAAQFYGSMGGTPLQRPVVGITPTAKKQGYWLVASDGGIFAFGNANYFGSIPGLGLHPAGSGLPNSLDAPIVGMVPSSTGNGYFMVASDGGVFAFGDAKFAGSCPGIGGCAGAAVAVMPDHSGNGYWLVTSVGSIYAFGDAPFFGAPAPQSSPVVSAVATPDGGGYWILYANGTVLNFGDAASYGNPAGYVNGFNPATSIFPTTDGLGYWIASARGDVFSYGNAPFLGSMSATPLNGPIIAAFGF
jgi:hypothetical protein